MLSDAAEFAVKAQGAQVMFVPRGYLEFKQAVLLLPDVNNDWGDDPKGQRLGSALASGDLIGHGIVVDAEWNGEIKELGEIRELRPETWRLSSARDAVLGRSPTNRMFQDGFILTPIISEKELIEWRVREFHSPPPTSTVPGLSHGVHAVPDGFIAFDQIPSVARFWAAEGEIDEATLSLLDPPDTDSVTQALASGTLRACGVNKRTGELVSLPPAVWRMELCGHPQSIWAIAGSPVLDGPEGDSCLPVVSRADLARALGIAKVPPDPPELPEGWTPAERLSSPPRAGDPRAPMVWVRGYAQGFKANGRLVKREEAIQAAMAALSCTSRQAEAAYEALPYPDLRNPPRKATA